ncbi:glycan biosynthesis hexose transferase WsfD [Actinomycetospora aeridis]|uniref:Membrane protein DUF2142 n=1 Tax=Actinomycetospora aeridis TaxID=3129231 RepID=A0ABU8NCX5_9PSEU
MASRSSVAPTPDTEGLHGPDGPTDTPPGTPRPEALGALGRLLLAVLAALVVAAALVGRLGLVGADGIGAGDNADGARLYCAAELTAVAPDGRASWRDVVVTEFRTGGEACPPEAPVSSAGLVLRAAVAAGALLDGAPAGSDGAQRFSLEWLGVLYVGLLALGAGAATWAASARRSRRHVAPAVLAVIVPPVAPLLLVPWWSRFLVSTYAEPAGLVGTVWVALGLLAVAVTRPADRGARLVALGLLAAGGVLAASAKPGFLPIGLVAVVACLLVGVGGAVGTGGWRRRVAGLVAALLTVAVAAVPVWSGIRAQDDYYEVVNAHNLAFTAVLPESGPAATAGLGLRPDAWGHSGEGFYLDRGRSVPGWQETVGDRPAELRADAYRWLAAHPRVLARVLQRGMVATMRPQMPYLITATGDPGQVVTDGPVVFHPEAPPFMGPFFSYTDEIAVPWLPAALVVVSVLGAVATVVVTRRRGPPATASGVAAVRLVRVAAGLAVAGTGVVVLAVIGDGYYELVKHVWLGSYAFAVSGVVLAGAVVAAGTGALLARGRTDP